MAIASFILPCLVQRHVFRPRLCVELWLEDRDATRVLQEGVHTTLRGDRAHFIFLLRSRSVSSARASVIRFRGQLFYPLQTSSLNFLFRTFFCLSQAEFALSLFAFIITLNTVYLPPFIFLLLLVNLSYIHVLLPLFMLFPIHHISLIFSGQNIH